MHAPASSGSSSQSRTTSASSPTSDGCPPAQPPREEHRPFYDLVWPKNDDFWLKNQPGTLWNCKCDWEQTDEDPTPPKERDKKIKEAGGTPGKDIFMPGLDENPAITGHIFTDTAAYIKNSPAAVENYVRRIIRDTTEQWAYQHIQEKKVFHPEIGQEITFTRSGIDDYMNQPFTNDFVKFEMIRSMPNILVNAKYVGKSMYRKEKFLKQAEEAMLQGNEKKAKSFRSKAANFECSYIFETTVCGEKKWLVVQHWKCDGNIKFHSISESETILQGLIKK